MNIGNAKWEKTYSEDEFDLSGSTEVAVEDVIFDVDFIYVHTVVDGVTDLTFTKKDDSMIVEVDGVKYNLIKTQ